MKVFSKEQLEEALLYRAQNITADPIQLDIVEHATFAGGALANTFATAMALLSGDDPEAMFAALFLYAINIAYTMDELKCSPGDFHCLEHKAKNCECAGTSQVGKREVLNPAGPKYF